MDPKMKFVGQVDKCIVLSYASLYNHPYFIFFWDTLILKAIKPDPIRITIGEIKSFSVSGM